MRLATRVSVNTAMGGYTIKVGEEVDIYTSDKRIIDRIEVSFQEYPDHSESFVQCMSGGVVVRELFNCPIDAVYQEATHD